jgi:diketogulonate reductase-like aldo/keto reductase
VASPAQSTTPARVAENADIFGWDLAAADMAALDGIEERGGSQRFCWDPTGVA